jgi:hypothetical protein
MNSKHPLYKEKLRLEKEIYQIWKIQRNQNWVELEKPYKDGYYKFHDLREDIKNRDDAWVFYECLKLVGKRVFCRDKSFKTKLGKGKYEYLHPGFGEISEETYEKLHPAVKKHFLAISPWSRRWNPFRKTYECTVPSYYFVEKIKPRWITHYQEFDYVLEQEVSEKKGYLCQKKYWPVGGWYGGRGNPPKDYRKDFTRSDRNYNKKTLKRNLSKEGYYDDYEYRYNHRHSARWMWW